MRGLSNVEQCDIVKDKKQVEKRRTMKFLHDIQELTGNKYAGQSNEMEDERITIDTGSYTLNALLSGSIYGGACGKSVTAFAGAEATGKTFLVLGIIKQYLDNNPDGVIMHFETEGAVSKNLLEERGIDSSRVYIIPVITIQDFRSQAMKIVNQYEETPKKERTPMAFVLDSLGMLSTNKEVQDIADAKDTRDMTRAQLVRGTFRALTLKMKLQGIPFFITNHTYDVVGSMFPTKEIAGGGGVKYAASTIVVLSKKKEKDGNEVVGNVIHCKTYKSRLSKENQMIDVKLYYESGLDRYYGLLELGEKYGVIDKIGNRFVIGDAKVYAKSVYKDPEKYFSKELLDKIDKASQKEFSYGSSVDDENGEAEVETEEVVYAGE